MEALFHYIFLRVFCYSTESEEKVREALLFLGYGDKKAEAKIEEQVVEGSFGDKIKIMELKIEKAREVKNLCRNIMPFLELRNIGNGIDDECFLHMRFSKEKAFEGHAALANDNNIISFKGKIKAYPSSRENAISAITDAIYQYHNN